MADRIANALNLLGADGGLLNSKTEGVLDLINEYWADTLDFNEEGTVTPPIH